MKFEAAFFSLLIHFVLFNCSIHAQESVEYKNLSEPEYQQRVSEFGNKGFYIAEVAVETNDNDVRFDVTFKDAAQVSVWFGHHHLTDRAFRSREKKYAEQGLELSIHQKYHLHGRNLHLGVWKDKKAMPLEVWNANDTIPQHGKTSSDLKPLDDLLADFIRENQIPGATLAISKDGKLVYDRSFGFSEIESKTEMQPGSMMRIASISKPVTATAVLQLVDQKKLKLNDRVFEILSHKPMRRKKIEDDRLNEVTIKQLLQHTGGFDRDASFDPMFRSRQIASELRVSCPPNADQIIKYMMTRPLDFDPGTKYGYSNIGYSLLGRVIEKVSGQKYEDYVRNEVLRPVGADGMYCGKTRRQHKRPQEAVYYQEDDRNAISVFTTNRMTKPPYGAFCVEAMDSHGGWVASASDLVKFADAFNEPQNSKLLSVESIAKMYACPDLDYWKRLDGSSRSVYYGMGWNVRLFRRGVNTWHMGKLPGTSTLLVRRRDGFNWAIMFNTSKCEDDSVPAEKIDPLIHRAVNQVHRWPK